MKVEYYESENKSHSVVSDSLWPRGLQSMEFSRPAYWSEYPLFSRGSSQPRDWTEVPHCRWTFYQLSHKGSPYSIIVYSILFFAFIINVVISNFVYASGNTCLSICSVYLKVDLACLLYIVALQSSYANVSYLWFMSPCFHRNLPIFGIVKLYILPIW